jgi:hypothetical protein
MNFKLGLTNHMDLQFVLDTFVLTEDASGVGEFMARVKVLWGNDAGRTALSVAALREAPLPASELRNGKMEEASSFLSQRISAPDSVSVR